MRYVSLYKDRHMFSRSCYNLSVASGGAGHGTLPLWWVLFSSVVLFSLAERKKNNKKEDKVLL
jgi:hypothetical protein